MQKHKLNCKCPTTLCGYPKGAQQRCRTHVRIDNSWTLFLDRDGIINKKTKTYYLCKWSEFKFIPSFLKTIPHLAKVFGRIIIVTNQRCIAREQITRSKLNLIHKRMIKKIRSVGGKIDKLYYCPHETTENCKCRKPKIGMAKKAKKEFKEINLKKSVMIGDSPADMEFGKKAGMITAFINKKTVKVPKEADFSFTNIGKFYSLLRK